MLGLKLIHATKYASLVLLSLIESSQIYIFVKDNAVKVVVVFLDEI